jgi:rhodanese-related sulfurtransferase
MNEHTSAGAALLLYQMGFTRVYALLGGLNPWIAAGYPTEFVQQQVQ